MQVRHNTGSCVLLYIPLLEITNEIISKKQIQKQKTPYILDNPFFSFRISDNPDL